MHNSRFIDTSGSRIVKAFGIFIYTPLNFQRFFDFLFKCIPIQIDLWNVFDRGVASGRSVNPIQTRRQINDYVPHATATPTPTPIQKAIYIPEFVMLKSIENLTTILDLKGIEHWMCFYQFKNNKSWGSLTNNIYST